MTADPGPDDACPICHASVHPDQRDKHLAWHTSLLQEIALASLL